MKNKIIAAVVTLIVIVFGIIIIFKVVPYKGSVKKITTQAKGETKAAAVPAKKAISKGKGALLVKILDSKDKSMTLGVKAFKVVDNRSSVYSANFMTNKPHELLPGSYDIEIATVPPKIYKNVRVAEGRENIEDLGKITGSVNVKLLNAQKKEVRYVVRVLYPNTTSVLTTGVANKPVEVIPGTYDVEIETLPKTLKKGIKVEAAKESALEIGMITGTLFVKVTDNSGKELREIMRLTKSPSNEFVSSPVANRRLELVAGNYNVEIMSSPRQIKKDLIIKPGEETAAEFIVQPAVPVKR